MRLTLAILLLSLAFAAPAAARFFTIDDVRAIAFDRGIVQLKDVELDRGIWEVEGFDASGHKIKMQVDSASGIIVKLKRKD
jgi:hypothetical protein